jgi:hypothetical protein
MSSWVVFTNAPEDCRSVASVRRKYAHIIIGTILFVAFVILGLTAVA